MLQDFNCRNAKPKKKAYKLTDSHGLYLHVQPSGVKAWRYRYRFRGKAQVLTIGRYPAVSLKEAREKRDQARILLDQGKNPSLEKKRKKLEQTVEKTFQVIAQEWHDIQKARWTPGHAEAVWRSLEMDVFPSLGLFDIDDITPRQVLAVLRQIEGRGALEQARKTLQRIGAIFRYAIQTGRANYNPAQDMQGALKPQKRKRMPALEEKDLPEFLRKLDTAIHLHITTRLALQFVLFTACRSGEVRGARWEEIDFEKATWTIPPERMKMRREHKVPLSRQALQVLEQAKSLPGQTGEFVFPGIRQGSRILSENTLQLALKRLGYAGKATVHGFRSVFSTIANESCLWPPDVIEKALAHVDRNEIRAAYNRGDLFEKRRELMQWWADLLDQLKGKETVK